MPNIIFVVREIYRDNGNCYFAIFEDIEDKKDEYQSRSGEICDVEYTFHASKEAAKAYLYNIGADEEGCDIEKL